MADTPKNPDDEDEDLTHDGGYGDEADDEGQEGSQALGKSPAVAANKGKTMLMAGAGGILLLFVMYQLFFAEEDIPPPEPPKPPEAAPVAESTVPLPTVPLEPPPPPEEPEEPETPDLPDLPPLPEDPESVPIDINAAGPSTEQEMARRKSNMMVMAGTGKPEIDAGGGDSLGGSSTRIVPGSAEDTFKSASPRAVATHVGDLRKLILQGKIIQAVLETAIDTTFPGPLRGIVARDVYAESGKTVLVPKGSRLIGNYNADVVRGQARIFIIWNRLIRPDGVDIDIGSPAVDALGRAGIVGFVDSRYFEIFSSSLLTSVFTIGTAAIAQSITGAQSTTTSNNANGQTQTADPTSVAIQQAVTGMTATAQKVLGGLIDARPLITVDQGTPVNVFVNKDLEFPDEVTGRIKLVE